MNKINLYEKINNQVLEGLKKQGLNWFKPWKAGKCNQPMNFATGKFYRGFNIFMLNFEMIQKGYEFNQWMTYKQAQSKGGQVKTGSKSTDVYFYKVSFQNMETGDYIDQPEGDMLNYRKTFALRYYKVFNIAQVEGIEPIQEEVQDTPENEPIEIAEKVTGDYLKKESIKFTQIGDSAHYQPKADLVNMPVLESFQDSDSYYKVLFHELAHSTGHKTRLNRKGITDFQKFGDTNYAKEELIAEISAMYLSGLYGLEPSDSVTNSQAYIQGWCRYLKDKAQECVNAMQQATKVVEFIQE